MTRSVRLGRRETVCVSFSDEGPKGLVVYVACPRGNPVAIIDKRGVQMLREPTLPQKVMIKAWLEWLQTDASVFNGVGVPRLLAALRGTVPT